MTRNVLRFVINWLPNTVGCVLYPLRFRRSNAAGLHTSAWCSLCGNKSGDVSHNLT
jgi:hypothetical protein